MMMMMRWNIDRLHKMEASHWFKIPQRSIANWWKNHTEIVGQKIGSRHQPNAS
ncbi:hypothetical protein BGX38DRAFT_1153493 [Terfezia claveryi]|nr:hypothetical protein BGX38DRAFT_1153493 [Terfezia claveryi]